LARIIPELSATRNALFKVIRSNIEIAITPPRIAQLRSNLVQSKGTVVCSRRREHTANAQGSKHRSRIRYLSKKNSRILTNFPKLKKFVQIRTKIR